MIQFSKEQTIPQVLAQFPQARAVFDRYGLRGCGGALGPQESLEFFSAVHGVNLESLLSDLSAAADSKAEAEPYRESLADIIYKRFFRAALLVLLAAGASTGVLTLVLAALRGSFISPDLLLLIQAHANVQIFGWIGLFVMGFACQGLPRFKYVALARPEWVNLSLILMSAGVALRALAAIPSGAAPYLGVASGALESGAILLFLWVIGLTLRRSETRDAWDKYVYFSLGAFLVMALAEPVLGYWVYFAPDVQTQVSTIATFYGPYRDVQLLGFAGMMVFGVAQRILPAAFGFRLASPAACNGAFITMTAGLALDVISWFAFRANGARSWAIASWAGTLTFYAGALWLAFAMRGFAGGAAGRSRKFINAAFWWLCASAALTALLPIQQMAIGSGFAHGLYGAARHAFAIGFLSLMIVGVSAKVVPVLKGLDPQGEPALWLPFLLINAGTALRVVAQPLSDFNYPGVFAAAAASGGMAAFGFFLWGFYMWRLLGRSAPAAANVTNTPSAAIGPDSIVARVVDANPAAIEVFESFGFKEIKNPFLRKTIARTITIRAACAMKNINMDDFLRALGQSPR